MIVHRQSMLFRLARVVALQRNNKKRVDHHPCLTFLRSAKVCRFTGALRLKKPFFFFFTCFLA